MKFEYEVASSLPPLSWCARLRPGASVRVRMGSDVETRPEGFVEGAWDGDYDAFAFDQALTFAGSGGRMRGGSAVFAAPFHPLERLYVQKHGVETLVSNSMVFLLAQSGDKLDHCHPFYIIDFLRQSRHGIAPPARRIRTASGIPVELYPCCNLEWNGDGSLRRIPKPLGPPPTCYADYFSNLLTTSRTILANANWSGRGKTYRFVAACSRGYDSTASAALVSQAGCKEGVTFVSSFGRVGGHPFLGTMRSDELNDNGADILRALGITAHEFERRDLRKLPGLVRAEFFMSPGSIGEAGAVLMQDALRGSLFVSGRHGERYWGPTSRCGRENFREVDDCFLAGYSTSEFRLRIGFLDFPLPYVGALHGPAIYRITHSEEMRPWSLGSGYYDRPIARRIAEEAGVPREWFGQRKAGAGIPGRELNDESERDFQQFLESEVPLRVRRRLDPRPLEVHAKGFRRITYLRTHYAHWPGVHRLLELLGTDRQLEMGRSIYAYLFHWGFARTGERYRSNAGPT